MEPQYLTDKEALTDALNKGDVSIWNDYIDKKRAKYLSDYGPEYQYYADLKDFKYDGGGKTIKGELNLTKSHFEDSKISNITFDNLLLDCAASSSLALKNVSLRNSSLDNSVIINSELDTVDISGANLFGADLTNTNLKNIKLDDKTNLKNVYFGDLDIEELRDIENIGLSEKMALEQKISHAQTIYPNISTDFLEKFFKDNTIEEIALNQAKKSVDRIDYGKHEQYKRPKIDFDFGIGNGIGSYSAEKRTTGSNIITTTEERTDVILLIPQGLPEESTPLLIALPDKTIVSVENSKNLTLAHEKNLNRTLNTDLYTDLNLVLTNKLGLNAGANHSSNAFADRTGIHAGINFYPTENFSITGGVEKAFLNYNTDAMGTPGSEGDVKYNTNGYNIRLATTFENNNFKGMLSASIPLENSYSDLGPKTNTDYTSQYFFSKIPTSLNLEGSYKFKNGLSFGLYASLLSGTTLSYSTSQPVYIGTEVNSYSGRGTDRGYYTAQQLSELAPGQEFPFSQYQLGSSFDKQLTIVTDNFFTGVELDVNQFVVGARVAFDFGSTGKKPGGVGR